MKNTPVYVAFGLLALVSFGTGVTVGRAHPDPQTIPFRERAEPDPTCGGHEYQQMHNLLFDGVTMTCKQAESIPRCRNVPNGFGCIDWMDKGDPENWETILNGRPKNWEEAWQRKVKGTRIIKGNPGSGSDGCLVVGDGCISVKDAK